MKSLSLLISVLMFVAASAKADDATNALAGHLELHHLEHLVALNKLDASFQANIRKISVVTLPHSSATDPAFKVTAEQYPAADGTKSVLETTMNISGRAITDTTRMATGPSVGVPTWPAGSKEAITLAEDAQHHLLDPAQTQKPELQPFIVALSSFELSQVGSGASVMMQVDIFSSTTPSRFRIMVKPDGTVASGTIVTSEIEDGDL